MTVTLEISQAVEQALTSDAQQRGMTPEQLLADELRQQYAVTETLPQDRHERVRQLLQWVRSLPHGVPPLSDEAVSREAIYAREDDVNYGNFSSAQSPEA